ncbi:transposase [Alteromonas ponticola]|uniref:Transposase n=1 Tax=Alteromonas aquimaris TaxID=2998417 RepID=A0ABT3P986_9ALTE|nr:transposase [Alteromonas aquimaris]MCW8109280.1 transposase [Alteromonas aquimaris]
MPRPRKSLINLSDTPYYHCVSRCVRRAFLCGKDKLTGKNYEYRRQWVEDRLMFLADVFCVDVCAYAVMSNHTHVVLRINKQKAESLSVKDIIRRWHRLFNGMLLAQRYIDADECVAMSEAEINTVNKLAEVYRHRLYNISWFMRLLNEYIARQANKEDSCSGHFWEGRFKSQALMDEASLAACMAYVDLNPVRAKLAKTPEESAHTSIQKRINAATSNRQPHLLLPFTGNLQHNMPDGLPFCIQDYLALVDVTGRHFNPAKRGKIDASASPILERVGLEEMDWTLMVSSIESEFKSVVSVENLTRQCDRNKGYNST